MLLWLQVLVQWYCDHIFSDIRYCRWLDFFFFLNYYFHCTLSFLFSSLVGEVLTFWLLCASSPIRITSTFIKRCNEIVIGYASLQKFEKLVTSPDRLGMSICSVTGSLSFPEMILGRNKVTLIIQLVFSFNVWSINVLIKINKGGEEWFPLSDAGLRDAMKTLWRERRGEGVISLRNYISYFQNTSLIKCSNIWPRLSRTLGHWMNRWSTMRLLIFSIDALTWICYMTSYNVMDMHQSLPTPVQWVRVVRKLRRLN